MDDPQINEPAVEDVQAEDQQSDAKAADNTAQAAEDEAKKEADGEDAKADDDDQDDDNSGDSEKPRKASRYQRMKRRQEWLAQENEALRQQLAKREDAPQEQQSQQKPAPKSEEPPKEEDYNDWFEYQKAYNQWTVRQEIRQADQQRQSQERERQQKERRREVSFSYAERVDEAKELIPDFAEVVGKANVQMPDDTIYMIMESDKGPLLAYHLAKNPDLAQDLAIMPPIEAAREIGRLESRLKSPDRKIQTTAPKPHRPPSGGAAAATDPSKMTMEEYAAWRSKGA